MISVVATCKTPSTGFVNVDLEIESRESLAALIDALGDDIFVLRDERVRGIHRLACELDDPRAKTLGACLAAYVPLLRGLRGRARKVWSGARTRRLDIGIEAGGGTERRYLQIDSELIAAMARVGVDVAITVYPPARQVANRPALSRMPSRTS